MMKLRAFWRDSKIVARTVWINLVLFAALLAATTLLLRLSSAYSQAGWLDLLVDAFHMAVLERVASQGDGVLPAVLTFVVPVLTFVILGEGVLRVLSAFVARGEHREEWDRMVAKSFKGHTVICGVGELGRALVQHLLEADPDTPMVLVDPRPGILAEIGVNRPNVCQIVSDMTSLETLKLANCQSAKLIVLTSGQDSYNLEAAFKTLQLNPQAEIWIRLYRSQLAGLFEDVKKPNLHFFCPYHSAAEDLVAHIQGKDQAQPSGRV